ncbi:MAG: hypothetical protein ACKV19_20475 [Verrucomicrobiales bacterium]
MNAHRTCHTLLILGVLGNFVGAGALWWARRSPEANPALAKAPGTPPPLGGTKTPGHDGTTEVAMADGEPLKLSALSVWKDSNPKTCEVPWSLAARRLGPLLEEGSDAGTTHSLRISERYRFLLGLSLQQCQQLESGWDDILRQKRDELKQSARVVELPDGGNCVELAMDHARDRRWLERAVAALPKDLSREQRLALEAGLAREPRFQVEDVATVRVYVEPLSDGAWQHVTELIWAEGASRREEVGPWTPYSFLLPAQDRWEALVRRRKE